MEKSSKSKGLVYHNDIAWEAFSKKIREEAPSKIFILMDENTNFHCLPYFLEKQKIENHETILIPAGEELMEKYNKESAIVFNTLQCYRWDRLDYLKGIHKRAKEKGYKLGFKIVRGAYMEKENDRATEKGYKTPICESKKATDDNFNEVMKYIMDNLNDIELFIGTHNESSNYLAMELMKEKEILKSDNRIWFGQLYGMSDHITFNLGAEGYNVAKYIPFGPVKDVMPYLIRRAEENTSVAGQTSRELTLLKKEKERRKL